MWGRKQADGYVVDHLVISGDVPDHNIPGLDPVNKQVLVLLQQQELPQHHVGLVEALLVGVNGGRPRENGTVAGEILVVPRGEQKFW